MPMLAAAVPFIAAGLSVASTIASSNAARAQGKAQQNEADYVAAQDVVAGNNAAGAGQRAAISQEKQTQVAESNAAGASAMSGTSGSASDSNNLAIIGGEGNYRSMTALYGGASKQQSYENQAQGSTYQGQLDKNAANTRANTILINGASSLFSKYGSTSPGSDSTDTAPAAPPGYVPTYYQPLTA